MEELTFSQILGKIKDAKLETDNFDTVIGIGRGGIVPGSLIANYLKTDFAVLWLNFRDDSHCPRHEKPKLVKDFDMDLTGRKVLVVDDVSKSGATLTKAKEILKAKNASKIKTLVVNGPKNKTDYPLDYTLFSFEKCVKFPWN
ncbi:MAG: phosphoribosyltransferase [Nanoarchaeota archaeon]|nr:phosphoribosyltransferase [Nanoarchaeota archaeon]